MRTFAQKQNQPQKAASSILTRSAVKRLSQTDAEEFKPGLTGTASSRFGHDFSRVPVHSPTTAAIQAKLAINQPEDEYEREADRVSERVMHMSESRLQRACPCGGECPKCQMEQLGQEHERLQTKHMGSSDLGETAVPPIVHEVLHSLGQPLEPAARLFMETRFGHDFSKLRVHTNAKAAESAQAIGAAAYTAGNDIVFGAGEFNPQNSEGRRLIAHELTHVVQQSKGSSNVQHISRQSKKGKVVRVEHAGKFSRRPQGPGAYTQAELDSWYERHPKATSAGGANLVDGERTKDKAYTPEELWRRGYYYAKTSAPEDTQDAWESWLNDEGDGKVITIFVRFNK